MKDILSYGYDSFVPDNSEARPSRLGNYSPGTLKQMGEAVLHAQNPPAIEPSQATDAETPTIDHISPDIAFTRFGSPQSTDNGTL